MKEGQCPPASAILYGLIECISTTISISALFQTGYQTHTTDKTNTLEATHTIIASTNQYKYYSISLRSFYRAQKISRAPSVAKGPSAITDVQAYSPSLIIVRLPTPSPFSTTGRNADSCPLLCCYHFSQFFLLFSRHIHR